MARNWTIQWKGGAVDRPATVYAVVDEVPTTLRPCDAFDPSTDWSVYLIGTVPAEHTGTGTLKVRIKACANTTTAADDVRWDVFTEFRTAGAGEALNASNIDATPDSGTMTFSTTAYSDEAIVISLTPATTPAAGDSFRIQVTRDANNGSSLDDLAVNALAVSYELYEEV